MPVENTLHTGASRLRHLLQQPGERAMRALHEVFPTITANDITLAGVIGVTAASALAAYQNSHNERDRDPKITLTAGLLMTGGILCDYLDGKMADVAGGSQYGHIIDAAADRAEETIMGVSRMYAAQGRGDHIGAAAALINTISNGLPSLARAICEMKGVAVPEDGGSLIGLLGTRAGRAIMHSIATFFPEVKGIPVQSYLDSISTLTNTLTTCQRLYTGLSGNSYQDAILSETERQKARERLAVFGPLWLCSAASAVSAWYIHDRFNAASSPDNIV